MKTNYSFRSFPKSRIATFDIYEVGTSKHHVSALLEFDVTDNRNRLKELRREGTNISFNAWLVKAISKTIESHPEAASYLYNKRKLIIFDDINVSFLIEKNIGDQKVPIPLVIEKANEKSAQEISDEINSAKEKSLSTDEIVVQKKSSIPEKLYYYLPGFIRRAVWRILLRNPRFAFNKMGNVVVTSVGMMGRINGWFIHKSVHPVSFGIGSVIRKPVVIKDEIKIREILNMTVLIDHDVIDGAEMVRFLNELTYFIEKEKPV